MKPERRSSASGSDWFHHSLQQLSHNWQKLNLKQLGSTLMTNPRRRSAEASGNNNKRTNKRTENRSNRTASKCSSWIVPPYQPLPIQYQLIRRQISEESIDFFDRFATIKERADRPRKRQQQQRLTILPDQVQSVKLFQQLDLAIPSGISEDESTPLPAPRSRPRSRISPQLLQQQQQHQMGSQELFLLNAEVEDVYAQVVYSVVHSIGRSNATSNNAEEILDYAKRVFQFGIDRHQDIVNSVRQINPPEVVLQLGVIQARHLKGKDVDGLSDPYCSIWVSSNRLKCLDTTMKPRTLDPVWNETLQFSVKDVNEDVLQLVIWDYDPEETVSEKMSRIGEVKDWRGFGTFVKQIASASKATPGKAAHPFLGQVNVPLKTIPLTGMERWYPLEGRSPAKSNGKERGDIKLSLSLAASRPEQQFTLAESCSQYERVLRSVVEHELVNDSEFRGHLPETATLMMRQLAVHRGLRPVAVDICTWSVLGKWALHKRTLDFTLLVSLVARIRRAFSIPGGEVVDPLLEQMFWSAADAVVHSSVAAVRHLRNNSQLSANPSQLNALLECLKELQTMNPEKSADLDAKLNEAVTMGAADWFSRAAGLRSKAPATIDDDDRLEHSIRLCQSLTDDLQTVMTFQQEPMGRVWGIDAFATVYHHYDTQLAAQVKPIIESITRALKSTHSASEDEVVALALEASGQPRAGQQLDEVNSIGPRLTMGTALFELYLCLQQFLKLSQQKTNGGSKLATFYSWFSPAVGRWLDIALYKALIRIGKAVALDSLNTVDSLVRYSSSAVDTVTVFYQIKTFWQQLNWPDAQGALAFVIKIIDDVNRCSTFYAEAIRLKLERLDASPQVGQYFISSKICAAINSIVHVRQSIEPLASEMSRVSAQQTLLESEEAQQTRDRLLDNAVDNINAKLDEVFYTIARRIETEVAKLINNALEADLSAGQMGRLSGYIYDQLDALNGQLDVEVFERVLHIVHQRILQRFHDVVLVDVDKRRQPACFRQWDQLLCVINGCFYGPDAVDGAGGEDDELLDNIRRLLKLHGADSAELIHLYRLERMALAKAAAVDAGLGSITVRASFTGDQLTLDILNGRNLKAMDSSGSADPYVKVQLLPIHHFPDATVLKTKVHKNTLFPLFDETFTFSVNEELQSSSECFVLITVKDKDLIGTNELIGEAFLAFQKIKREDHHPEPEQILLPLTQPPDQESEYLAVLEGRNWDKTARDFAKREKKRR